MHPAPQVQYPLTLQEPSCCIVRTLSILTNVVAIPDISLSRRVDFVIGVSGRSMEDTRHFRYTDKMEFHVIELPKLPVKESYTKLELWAKFINAEEKEEFDMIAEKDPYIDSAYRQLQIISQDKQLRMEYEAREKAIRDHNEMILEAEERGDKRGEDRGRKEGREEEACLIAANLISLGADMDMVIKATRLPIDLVEKLFIK